MYASCVSGEHWFQHRSQAAWIFSALVSDVLNPLGSITIALQPNGFRQCLIAHTQTIIYLALNNNNYNTSVFVTGQRHRISNTQRAQTQTIATQCSINPKTLHIQIKLQTSYVKLQRKDNCKVSRKFSVVLRPIPNLKDRIISNSH